MWWQSGFLRKCIIDFAQMSSLVEAMHILLTLLRHYGGITPHHYDLDQHLA
jgi:hypothetical protein